MHLLLRLSLPAVLAGALLAQYPGLTLPPSGNNQKAAATQFIGPIRISIEYSSPAVHGPDGKDRRGQIWGKLVPYGLTNLGFGNNKPDPWRAGANENTVFSASNDVLIEGKPLPAGHYGLHMIPGQNEWTIVFSKNATAWGSFFYDETEDALRVTVKPHQHEYREWLTYDFVTRKPEEATVELQWEDLAVPIAIKAEKIDDIYITRLRHELTTVPGFSYQGYLAASQYCLQSGKNLDQGLLWADAAIGTPFIGASNFATLDNKAQILEKMGKDADAGAAMTLALNAPGTTAIEIHGYGRRLLAAGKKDEALKVFQLNQQRNGDAWPVHVGLARGYAAVGDNQKALQHAKLAVDQAPDPLNKQNLEAMVKSLSEGKQVAR
jgi:hypothetical protein